MLAYFASNQPNDQPTDQKKSSLRHLSSSLEFISTVRPLCTPTQPVEVRTPYVVFGSGDALTYAFGIAKQRQNNRYVSGGERRGAAPTPTAPPAAQTLFSE